MNAMPPSSTTADISEAEFDTLAAIAANEAGLSIPRSKKSLVQSRIARRFRALNVQSCKEYISIVEQDAAELKELISVLTTNVSSFYRENHHFEFLNATVISHIRERLERGDCARLWSAGCSSGQEPYSIAMELLKAFPNSSEKDLLILASDIDPQILSKAKLGEYSAQELSPVSKADVDRFFTPVGTSKDRFQAKDELKKIIRFRELNLHGTWPMQNAFDAIFCRNVVIYFDEAHQTALWPRFKNQLKPDGFLFLGHSERIQDTEAAGFKTSGVTIYQRT